MKHLLPVSKNWELEISTRDAKRTPFPVLAFLVLAFLVLTSQRPPCLTAQQQGDDAGGYAQGED